MQISAQWYSKEQEGYQKQLWKAHLKVKMRAFENFENGLVVSGHGIVQLSLKEFDFQETIIS